MTKKYYVTVSTENHYVVEPFATDNPKDAITKWYHLNTYYPSCANIQAASKTDAIALITWAKENIELVKKEHNKGSYYTWDFIQNQIEQTYQNQCKYFSWNWDSVSPFTMG